MTESFGDYNMGSGLLIVLALDEVEMAKPLSEA